MKNLIREKFSIILNKIKQHKKSLYGVLFLFVFWLFCFHYTDTYQVAILRNSFNGKLSLDSKPGPNITAPWVRAAIIDTRPHKLCVTSSSRSFNCRLVMFDVRGWKEFVETEGFRYYWWDNRFSFNGGYDKEYRGMDDLLRGYSYDTDKRSFIIVLDELE